MQNLHTSQILGQEQNMYFKVPISVYYFQLYIYIFSRCVVSGKALTPQSNQLLENLKPNDIILTNFLNELTNKLFANCSLLLLQDSHNHGTKIDRFMEHSKFLPKYLAKHKKPENSFPQVFPLAISNTHQHGDRCIITFAFLLKTDTKFLEDFRKTFSPNFKPLIRMDFDYFVFVIDVKHHKKLLNLQILHHRYKFKVVVGISEQAKLVFTTTDFFGGSNGAPKIFRVTSKEEPLGNKELVFPDFTRNMRGYTMRVVLPVAVSLVEATPPPWIQTNNGKRGRWLFLITEYLMVRMLS